MPMCACARIDSLSTRQTCLTRAPTRVLVHVRLGCETRRSPRSRHKCIRCSRSSRRRAKKHDKPTRSCGRKWPTPRRRPSCAPRWRNGILRLRCPLRTPTLPPQGSGLRARKLGSRASRPSDEQDGRGACEGEGKEQRQTEGGRQRVRDRDRERETHTHRERERERERERASARGRNVS